MTQIEVWDRVAGRAILLDSDGRVLLFQGFDPARPTEPPWWYTPGGGVEPGETPQQAAARELAEETGLVVEPAALGEQVFENYVEFLMDGVLLRQRNHFFLLRTATREISTAGLDDVEQRTHLGHRWWSAEELEQSSEICYPEELAGLIAPSGGS
ncbi:NUDIX domain-containing protein [Actinospica durhamensis]|uniref:NUDIX domain-containing protein n=1 Tax=Actinospica durhamensis TaxID=1508375 RepID=A0A941EWN3_9ACTN|nr:NUDIX domain-containing protein [Actinospica durhamensis]MBR7839615.1 NUDIX domain-containing protein [Actinospica durhamensis]